MAGDTGSMHSREIASGQRFAFGKNWRNFLNHLNEDRIRDACRSLRELLDPVSVRGKMFLDAGSGSGLFSLAAMRIGAAEVLSFDYDPGSVACTRELKRRYFPEDARWRIVEASVLDKAFLVSLGQFDVVYSWGVLHHTGAMWQAMDNIGCMVKPDGLVAIAIYNDQGWKSTAWRMVKRIYCQLPRLLRPALFFPIPLCYELKGVAAGLLRGRAPFPSRRDNDARGMTRWHDWIDWLGGYPFEVARTEEVSGFFQDRGFHLKKLVACDGSGNNEFVFRFPEKKSGEHC